MTVTDEFKKQVSKTFGPKTDLSDDEYIKLQSLLDLFNKSMDDIFVEWESFNITEVKEDLDLNLSNLIRFQGYLQTKLAKNSTPVSKKTRDTIGSTSNRKQFRTVDNHHLTPQLKKRKFEDNTPEFKTPAGIPVSSPTTDYETANNTFVGLTTNGTPTTTTAKTTPSNSLLETLNSQIDEITIDQLPEGKTFRLSTNFDASKFKFRTMQMKLLESADVLDDQIDRMISLYQDQNKTADLQFGNPCMSTQSDILCCGRIVPDNPLYDKEILNSTSLFLETSRISGIGQRIPLDLSNLSNYSFFPGQIVVLKGKNPSGKSFIVEQNMPLPQLGAPVTSSEELKEFQTLQNNQGLKVLIASGPFSNLNKLNYDKLDKLVDLINTKILPQVVILNGPFLDIGNKVVESGEIIIDSDQSQPQPKTLDDLFKAIVTPVLKKIDSKIQVILYPNLRDTCIKHCSYPQDSFDRKKLGLPKNFKVFPNPSGFSINEVLIGNSNLDIFKDLRDIYKEDTAIISNNRFERIVKHIFEQRRYYPIFPGSIKTEPKQKCTDLLNGAQGEYLDGIAVGGSSLETPYLGLSELGDSLPDVLILPSELKYFAKVIQGVIVINPGIFIKPSKDPNREEGSYAVVNIQPPNFDAEDNIEAIDDTNTLYYHNVNKRSRVDIYSS